MRPRSTSRGRRRRGRSRGQGQGQGLAPPLDGAQPLPLFKRAASHFEPGDRQRGQDYFHEGRAQIEIDGGRARARVAGAEQPYYRVGVDWSRVGTDRVLHAYCDCQRFADGKPCKHVWATLLAFAEAAPDGQPAGKDRLSLRRDRAPSWPDLGPPATPEEHREAQGNGYPPRGDRPERLDRIDRGRRGRDRMPPGRRMRLRPLESSWRSQLAAVREEVARLTAVPVHAAGAGAATTASTATATPTGVRLLVDTGAAETGGLVLDVFESAPGSGPGKPGKLRRASLSNEQLERLLLPRRAADDSREPAEPPALVTTLPPEPPNRPVRPRRAFAPMPRQGTQRFRLPPRLYESVLPRLCARGLLGWWDGRNPVDSPPLLWDDGPPWRLALRLQVPGAGAARLSGALERANERVPLSSTVAVLGLGFSANGSEPPPALALFPETLARMEAVPARDLPWLGLLRETGELVVPQEELAEALTSLLELPALPPLETPDGLQLSGEPAKPVPKLVLEPDPAPAWTNPPLLAQLSYLYGGAQVSAGDPRPAVIDPEGQSFLRRDSDAEHRYLVRLLELGFKPVVSASGQGHGLELNPRDLPAVAEPLLREGWAVEVHGTTLRPPRPPALRIESGIDWFQLSGDVEFGGTDRLEMKQLLAAISKGERFVKLSDGSQGLVPAEWMTTYDSLAKLAHGETDDGLRFLPSQALLVDALLIALPPPSVDESFAALRDRLASFERIKPKKEPKNFVGTLRGYQRQGLGWLDFLREFGLGGVLADDMGLGKTVQVLALLEANRPTTRGKAAKATQNGDDGAASSDVAVAKPAAAKKARTTNGSGRLPSLVVAPRSLVYNWIDEAERFTPKLKVLDYTGADRDEVREHLGDYDLVVTTYGTLRRDVAFLASREFDTVILDEAQAIKNRESQAAKASRLLVARHRLALTGTPIENHLGELGSLFEFLNPGLLGRLPWLDVLAGGHTASREELALVAKGMRPFILRRTKAQVLEDLPPKTEQVLLTTLRPRQRELYDQLRAAYQASLLEQVEKQGVGRSAIQVLEALLRLRQVACHPGLVKPEWADAGSAKLEALFEQVSEVLDEGHKVLVFSQFTSLLAFVRQHLDGLGVPYAYLDGSTRDRGAVVERFQTDPKTNLFLISLKAGGVGLNLTAAGYVFLLDPWWNPAVEAQAIDRAHRIGQTRHVFAYRLIAKGTVEEKVLQLQQTKR
ncbi:MAG TPA: DEAD/DEAH box helicase, partial [Thermoanaerobaculia bacterium]|nr:DEAD/DEAH box helicase [Thermoanaerobaculia bacterium]